jgi:hypothetical protein
VSTFSRNRGGKDQTSLTELAPKRLTPILVALLGVVLIATLSNTASTAPSPGRHGEGAARISGYTISDVDYQFSDSDPTRIQSVSFTIQPAIAKRLRIRLVSTSDTWHECTTFNTHATCPTTTAAPTLATADELRIQATG